MVNASLNWASIQGLVLILFGIPAYLISLVHLDWLTRRNIKQRKTAFEWVLFVVTFCGRALCLPFVAGVLFFQGWRLDPILQFGVFLLGAGVIAEASASTLKYFEQNRHFESELRLGADDSQKSAMALRVQDHVWLWAILHASLPLVSFYYALTRRTITPFLWDVLVRFVVVLLSNLVVYVLGLMFGWWRPDSSLVGVSPGLILVFISILLGLNWWAAVFAARYGMIQAKKYARLHLGIQS